MVIRTVPAEQVTAGMYIVRLHGPWLQHPFWKTCFVVEYEDAARLHASTVEHVDIDTQLGADAEFLTCIESRPDTPAQIACTITTLPLEQTPCSFAEEIVRAKLICEDGRALVEAMFGEVRMGRTMQLDSARLMAKRIGESVAHNPSALVSLARLKTADTYTYLHSVAVGGLMTAIARDLQLPHDQQERAALAGLLHDFGKALTPSDILNKKGALLDAEFDVVRQHPVLGERLLNAAGFQDADVLHVVRHHHERMDGKGYPDQLPAEQLPLLTRISAVCDVYDAITSNRPYKAGWDPAESLRHMAKGEGHFDVEILKSLVRVLGIFPVGSLLRLQSGFLAVVIERGVHPLQPPLVRVFYSATLKIQVFPRDVDLSNCSDRIISIESPEAWGLKDLERFWCP